MRNFKELQAKMSPEARKKSEAKAHVMLKDMALDELREARELTQEALAGALGVGQAAISRMERRTDVYVSTLAKYIEALGGELDIRAVFPDGDIRITQFSAVAPGRTKADKAAR